jgi:hypothetical protein
MHFQTYVNTNYFYYLRTGNSFLRLCRVFYFILFYYILNTLYVCISSKTIFGIYIVCYIMYMAHEKAIVLAVKADIKI